MSLISKRLSLFSLPNTYRPSLRKDLGFPWEFAHAGKGQEGTGKLGWDHWEESGVCTRLRCKCWLLPGLRGGGQMRRNRGCGDAVLPQARFLSPEWQPRGCLPREPISWGFFSTQKKQIQAPQAMLRYGTEPSGLAWLASHKRSIKLHIKRLPFISAR